MCMLWWFQFSHMPWWFMLVTSNLSGSCFFTCHGGSCSFSCHGGSCFLTGHAGSCFLHVIWGVHGLNISWRFIFFIGFCCRVKTLESPKKTFSWLLREWNSSV